MAGDLLGVDRVLLDPGARLGLVVPSLVDRSLRVRDGDLEPLAGAWLAGDRAELLERAGLLLDVERGLVAELRQGLGGLPPDEALELRAETEDRPMWASSALDELLHGSEVRQVERREEVGQGDLLHLELLLEHRAAAEASLDLLRPQVPGPVEVLGPDALAASREREDASRTGSSTGGEDEDAREGERLRAEACDLEGRDLAGQQVQHVGGDEGDGGEDHEHRADRGRAPRAGRRRLDLEVDLDLAREGRLDLADALVRRADLGQGLAQRGQAVGRRVRGLEARDPAARPRPRRRSARIAPGPGRARSTRRSASRALSSIDRCSASSASATVRDLAGLGERVAVPLQLREGRLAVAERGRRRWRDRPRRPSASPGFLSPFVLRSNRPCSSLRRARLVPRSAPEIEAWSRSRRAASSRASPSSSWCRTEAVDRKKASLGMPVRSASTSSARVGIGDRLAVGLEPDGALRAAEGLLERAGPDAVEVLLLELEPDPRALLVVRAPRAEAVDVGRARRHAPRQRQLDRAAGSSSCPTRSVRG